MNSDEKCVMIVDQDLPIGWMANAAAILDITLGKHIPQAVGPDVTEKSGRIHCGIITVPVPILKADKESSGPSGSVCSNRNLPSYW